MFWKQSVGSNLAVASEILHRVAVVLCRNCPVYKVSVLVVPKWASGKHPVTTVVYTDMFCVTSVEFA